MLANDAHLGLAEDRMNDLRFADLARIAHFRLTAGIQQLAIRDIELTDLLFH